MKRVVLAVAVAALAGGASAQVSTEITPPPSVQLPADTPASTLLPGLIQHSRHVAQLADGRLTGEGADFLRALGAESQFVLIGEEHGNVRIAEFAGAYWRDLQGSGYRYAAVEIDPWVAAALERELRAGGGEAWRRYLTTRGGGTAAPFFTWDSEVRFAEDVVRSQRGGNGPTLWGLDQVFIGSAHWLLRDVAERAHDAEARALAAALAQEANAGGMDWIGRADAQGLISLRAELNGRGDSDHAALIDAMIVSQRIYRPFTGNGGEAYLANVEREALMKTTFLRRYRAAVKRADGAPPRVMLKFGSNHMMRGATPTHVQGLGGFVSEFAVQNGSRALSILTVCGPGGFVGTFDNPQVACDEYFANEWGFLAEHIDPSGITMFDLRTWRLRPRRWEHLPDDKRRVIDSYDIIAVVPNGAAVSFLPGLAPPARGGN